MIRLAVDAWNIPGDRRGIGRYVRAMLTAMRDEFADRVTPTLVIPEWATWIAGPRYNRAIAGADFAVTSRAALRRNARFDVLWFPFNGPSWDDWPAPAVATLHDASDFVLPGSTDAIRSTFVRAAERCERIVTDSEFSKRELVRVLTVAPERVVAIPLGVAPLGGGSAAIDPSRFGPYVLFVGETEARKGIDTLFATMDLLHARGVAMACVIVGQVTDAMPDATGRNAIVLGHVDDATLRRLYGACTAFVYPSRYEGFGLPVLEAMLAGAPVVASAGSGIPEAGGDAASYAEPGNAPAFADAIERIVRDEAFAADLRERGRNRALAMTWSRCAAALVNVFEEVARPRIAR